VEPLLEGVKVLELGELIFVPGAGAVLADWGADVIKVEPAPSGDSLRSASMASTLKAMGFDLTGFNFLIEQTNRGKRSICLDLKHPDGKSLFLRLVEQADVFITSTLEPSRERLGITYDDLKTVNPRLVYARGHGYGQRGPDAGSGGIETVAFFARSGYSNEMTPPEGPLARFPQGTGDITSGMFLAGGIAAALYRRTVTGEGGLIDVSLFGAGAWTLSLDIVGRHYFPSPPAPPTEDRATPTTLPTQESSPSAPVNPLLSNFRTSDGRRIVLGMVKPDNHWAGFCAALGLGELVDRYDSFAKRAGDESLFGIITERFASQPLSYWREHLDANRCVWSAVQTPEEVCQDPQAVVNGYIMEHPTVSNARLVASPVQYQDGMVEVSRGAPRAGEDTDEILGALGIPASEIERLRATKVVA
jgi:crotonobetainyl-CoA:carnitine CoA-transferase CaiB-like acyl-CoA transferase